MTCQNCGLSRIRAMEIIIARRSDVLQCRDLTERGARSSAGRSRNSVSLRRGPARRVGSLIIQHIYFRPNSYLVENSPGEVLWLGINVGYKVPIVSCGTAILIMPLNKAQSGSRPGHPIDQSFPSYGVIAAGHRCTTLALRS